MAEEKGTGIMIGDKEVVVKEINYLDTVASQKQGMDVKSSVKNMLLMGTNLTSEEIDNLSLKTGSKITLALNELNGLTTDFQKL